MEIMAEKKLRLIISIMNPPPTKNRTRTAVKDKSVKYYDCRIVLNPIWRPRVFIVEYSAFRVNGDGRHAAFKEWVARVIIPNSKLALYLSGNLRRDPNICIAIIIP